MRNRREPIRRQLGDDRAGSRRSRGFRRRGLAARPG